MVLVIPAAKLKMLNLNIINVHAMETGRINAAGG